jgi:DNA-binding MarR family transcriptional regulator
MADAKQLGDPGDAGFLLKNSPFFLIARVSGRYVLGMERVLKEIGMDMPGWRTLMIVREREPSSVSEIADLAVMRLSTMTRVVQRLELRGLVRLAARPTDARRTDVFLTADGRAMVRRVRTVASRTYRKAFHEMPAADLEVLNSLLRRVFDNLAPAPDASAARPSRRRPRAARR